MANGQKSDKREGYITFLEQQGKILDRYIKVQRIDAQAGSGSFSLMFTAFDEINGKTVILKVFDPDVNEPYRILAFDRESQILLKCKGQPNILQIVEEKATQTYQVQAAGGISFQFHFHIIALERAQCSIHEIVYAEKAKPLTILLYFKEVCKGIQRLHRLGIYHRDMKLSNGLVMPDKSVVVGDLGSAKTLDGAIPPLLTSYGVFHPGDRTYLAPEQSCGLDDWYLHGDIYALGAILFEMFTKVVLNNILFGQGIIVDLMTMFYHVPQGKKRDVYDGIISAIETKYPLPDMQKCDSEKFIPAVILTRLDALYRRLACLDYRRRLISFESVFHELNMMIIILRNEMKYKHWLEQQRLQRQKNSITD